MLKATARSCTAIDVVLHRDWIRRFVLPERCLPGFDNLHTYLLPEALLHGCSAQFISKAIEAKINCLTAAAGFVTKAFIQPWRAQGDSVCLKA